MLKNEGFDWKGNLKYLVRYIVSMFYVIYFISLLFCCKLYCYVFFMLWLLNVKIWCYRCLMLIV